MRNSARIIVLLAGFGILYGLSQMVRADEGMATCPACGGVAQETPNHRRQRLGIPIKTSFPAPEYGQKIETPNERRRRLGIALAPATPKTAVIGVSEETPNHKRQRLNSEASLVDSQH